MPAGASTRTSGSSNDPERAASRLPGSALRGQRFSRVAAPADRPLPIWILFPLFFVFVYLTHYTLLRLPWFWDEAGYYFPAALDLFRTGALIPHSTLSNAHPPMPSLLLAGWWHLAGLSIMGTRTFLCMVSAAALLGVFRLVRALAGNALAAGCTLLTALYPVWFVQSTLAHADLFAAAFTLWALSFYLERYGPAKAPPSGITVAALFSLAALSKETAIITPVALACWELARLLTERNTKADPAVPRASFATLVALLFPLLPLAAWYAYHRQQTGFLFGNPEFLRYNATANLSAIRILLSLWHRVVHLTLHMNLWVPVLSAAALLLTPRLSSHLLPLRKGLLPTLLVILFANAFAFSILGGALLTRYLLPMYPLVLFLCLWVWRERLRLWSLLALLTAAAFLAALFINPPYSYAPEDNLAYRDFVILHQQAIRILDRQYPAATVLTAWPATTELQHPELGYTSLPIKTTPIDNFTYPQLTSADPGTYDTALLFSTKLTPPHGTLNLSRANEHADTRLFDFHQDLSPAEAAALLHGSVVWEQHRKGEWAAILRFPRAVEARLRANPPRAPFIAVSSR